MAPKSDHYGNIKDVPVGTTFKDRAALAKAGVHRPLRAGIAPDSHTKAGVYSIVLNGGYEDDEDQGNFITYTGQGKGSKAATQPQDHGAQEGDQSWDTPGNKALKRSTETGRVVRVIRGSRSKSKFAPEVGFRYDGLYCAMNARRKIGKQGFKVCVVDLKRLPNQPSLPGDMVLSAAVATSSSSKIEGKNMDTAQPAWRQLQRVPSQKLLVSNLPSPTISPAISPVDHIPTAASSRMHSLSTAFPSALAQLPYPASSSLASKHSFNEVENVPVKRKRPTEKTANSGEKLIGRTVIPQGLSFKKRKT
ncbi:Carboxymuconolactone decarboxylase [Mycena kentingensis (nom. inval.)]|nr:Carboxymuconolactone decarboxylase [Mycena kentingensis (nom. inval.)]